MVMLKIYVSFSSFYCKSLVLSFISNIARVELVFLCRFKVQEVEGWFYGQRVLFWKENNPKFPPKPPKKPPSVVLDSPTNVRCNRLGQGWNQLVEASLYQLGIKIVGLIPNQYKPVGSSASWSDFILSQYKPALTVPNRLVPTLTGPIRSHICGGMASLVPNWYKLP